jgi:hypothetical protein
MFLDTANKKAIRTTWDSPILASAGSRLSRGLAYFGMPGGDIQDLLDWKDLLGIKTCIQRVRKGNVQKDEDLEIIRQINHNIMINKIKDAQVMRGDVEDIIISGIDQDLIAPRLSDSASGEVRFKYDLVNLDFLGGVAYKRKAGSDNVDLKTPRIKAIEELFKRQRGHNFILLLTVNVRDTFGDEPLQYLEEMATRHNSNALSSASSWCKTLEAGMKHHHLRFWLPAWIRELAEMAQFDCHCFPAVLYEGHERARMVHFAFEFRYISGRDLRIDSAQKLDTVVALPLIRVEDGIFKFLTLPGLPCAECSVADSVMSEDILQQCLSTGIDYATASA